MLDRESSIPLHTQLEELIRTNIATGTWSAGKLIPSENKIASEYGLSRMTVRQVISKLEQEGLVERIMGKGTYVLPPKMRGGNLKFDGIISQLERMGYQVTTKVVSIAKETVPANANVFHLPEDTVYYVIIRQRYMNSDPMSVHVTYVPADLAPGLEKIDLENKLLYTVLEKEFGLSRNMVTETWRADKAPKMVCDLLQIKPSEPFLTNNAVTRDFQQKVINVEHEYFRGDKISLYFEFL